MWNGLHVRLFNLEGHDEVNITIEIKPDDTPEVAEIFTVNLVNASDLDRIQKGAVSTPTQGMAYLLIEEKCTEWDLNVHLPRHVYTLHVDIMAGIALHP